MLSAQWMQEVKVSIPAKNYFILSSGYKKTKKLAKTNLNFF